MEVSGGYVPFLAKGILSLTVMLSAFQQTSWSVSAGRTDIDAYTNDDQTTKNQFGRRDDFNVAGSYELNPNNYLDVSIDLCVRI